MAKTKKSQSGTTLLPFLALIIIAVLITANIWLYFKIQKVETQTQTPTTQTTVNAADSMADWQTYTQPEDLYSFKYPTSFNIYFPLNKNSVVINSLSLNDSMQTSSLGLTSAFTIDVVENTSAQAEIDSIIREISASIVKTEHVINGNKVTQLTFIGAYGGEIHVLNIIAKDKNIFVIKHIDNSEFDQILSTFRFADDTIGDVTDTPETSDWQTYTDTESRFQFEYPSTWTATETSPLGFAAFEDPEASGASGGVYIQKLDKQTLNEALKAAEYDYVKSQTIPDEAPRTRYRKPEIVTINNHSAVKRTYVPYEVAPPGTDYIFAEEGITLNITELFIAEKNQILGGQEAIHNHILSTFRFINN